jgi:hypothetical protein
MGRLRLICVLVVIAPPFTGCGGLRRAPDAQTQKTPECRQMQDKLTNDKTLSSLQAAEIMQSMEKAGCGGRLPGF